jgi:prefoldin subunit 5
MTPEDMERAFEFLIKHHAELAARQAEFDARMDREHQENIEEHRRIQAEQDETRRLFSDAILTLTGSMGRLADAEVKLDEAQAKTELRLAELTERVDAFIAYVERYIEESRNGRNRN